MKKLALDSIRTDGGTQVRTRVREDYVFELREVLQSGSEFKEDVVVFFDGTDHWLADGYNRLEAYRAEGHKEIAARIMKGSRRDALLYALTANTVHGLRLTHDDKRNKIRMALADPELAKLSDRLLAERCCVSHPLVAEVRKESSTGNFSSRKTRTSKDGRERPATPAAKEPDFTPSDKQDAFGNKIPKGLLDAWADGWIQRTFDLLVRVEHEIRQERVVDGMRKRQKHYPWFDLTEWYHGAQFTQDSLEAMIAHLKEMRPAGVCPSCQGKKCPDCKFGGLVPRKVYEELVKKREAS